jgi:hypothetical protein
MRKYEKYNPQAPSPFIGYTQPQNNHFLENVELFRHLKIKQALALSYNISFEHEISISNALNNPYAPRSQYQRSAPTIKHGMTIYFKTGEGLKEYFSTRVRQQKKTIKGNKVNVTFVYDEEGLKKG